MRSKQVIRVTFSLGLLLLGGCAGAVFNVSPRPVGPPVELAAGATPGSLEVGAAFLDDERALDRLGANLPSTLR